MHGKGTFFDPRLDDAAQFPIAAANGFGHVNAIDPDDDRITAEAAGAARSTSSRSRRPTPPTGSFDAAAAARGEALFTGKAQVRDLPRPAALRPSRAGTCTRAAEIGIDDFQADRAPDRRYRTAPLAGLWTHTKGGFYHDGRFATLLDVVDHYDAFFNLGLTAQEKNDLVEYLKSLPSEK